MKMLVRFKIVCNTEIAVQCRTTGKYGNFDTPESEGFAGLINVGHFASRKFVTMHVVSHNSRERQSEDSTFQDFTIFGMTPGLYQEVAIYSEATCLDELFDFFQYYYNCNK